ncbi:MAG: TRAP transporter small permease [Oscillospiraceae bacterium]|nr:TRAP transporter small permease [Oscillospiraceae bacterium]
MKALKACIIHIEEVLGVLLLIAFVGLTIVNVFLRYTFRFIMPWAEELILFFFLWSVLVGAINGYRKDTHVAIDFVYDKFPKPVKKAVTIFNEVIIFALNAYMAYLAWVLISNVGVKSTNVLRMSYVYVNASLLVCFVGLTLFGFPRLYRAFTGKLSVKTINEELREIERKEAEEKEAQEQTGSGKGE